MPQQDTTSVLPILAPFMDKTVEVLVETKDRLYAMFSKGTDGQINSLGARVSVLTAMNPNYGNNQIDGGGFREPGSFGYKQFIIQFVGDNASLGLTGAAQQNIQSNSAFGLDVTKMLAYTVEYLKRQRDIDFSHGNGSGQRALVASVTSSANTGSVVVMDAQEGTRFLDENGIYIAINPLSPATPHGITTGHTLLSKASDNITATFLGATATGTAVTTGDIFVNKGDSQGNNSYNRAIYGLEYFFGNSGDYFGLSKDSERRIQGMIENGFNNNVSRSLLLRGELRYRYFWADTDDDDLSAMLDVVSIAQYGVYELLGYALTQYMYDPAKGELPKFDGKIKIVSDGSRQMIRAANVRPTNWFRIAPKYIRRYQFEPTALWTRDGSRWRSVYGAGVAASAGMPANAGQIMDLTSCVVQGKEQMFNGNPRRGVFYQNLGTNGVFQGVN